MKVPLRRIGSFIGLYADFAREGIRPYPGRFLTIAVLDSLSALTRGAMIVTLAVFVGLMDSREPITVPLIDVTFESDLFSVVLMSGCLLGMQFFSGWAAYFSSAQTLKLGRSFYVSMVAKILDAYAQAPRPLTDEGLFERGLVQRYVMQGARQSGIAVETLIRIMRSALYCVVAVGLLFFVDWKLTLLLLPGLALIAPLAYRMSAGIQSDARNYFSDLAQKMGAYVSRQVRLIDAASYAARAATPFAPTLADSPPVTNFLDAFNRNRLANDRMVFMVSSVNACVIALMVLVFGYYATQGDRPWTAAIAFLGSLLYLATALQGLFSYVSLLSLFYPQTRAAAAFLQAIADAQDKEPRQEGAPGALEVRTTLSCEGSRAQLVLARGAPVLVLATKPLSWASFGAIAGPLTDACNSPSAPFARAEFVSFAPLYPEGALLASFQAISGPMFEADVLKARYAALDCDDVLAALPDGLRTKLSLADWQDLPQRFRCATRLLPLVDLECEAVLIDESLLSPLGPDARRELLRMLGDRFVLIVATQAPEWSIDSEMPALLLIDGNVVCAEHAGHLRELQDTLGWDEKARSGSSEGAQLDDETLMNF